MRELLCILRMLQSGRVLRREKRFCGRSRGIELCRVVIGIARALDPRQILYIDKLKTFD